LLLSAWAGMPARSVSTVPSVVSDSASDLIMIAPQYVPAAPAAISQGRLLGDKGPTSCNIEGSCLSLPIFAFSSQARCAPAPLRVAFIERAGVGAGPFGG